GRLKMDCESPRPDSEKPTSPPALVCKAESRSIDAAKWRVKMFSGQTSSALPSLTDLENFSHCDCAHNSTAFAGIFAISVFQSLRAGMGLLIKAIVLHTPLCNTPH